MINLGLIKIYINTAAVLNFMLHLLMLLNLLVCSLLTIYRYIMYSNCIQEVSARYNNISNDNATIYSQTWSGYPKVAHSTREENITAVVI